MMNYHHRRRGLAAAATLGLLLGGCTTLGFGSRAVEATQARCADFSFPVYFNENSDQLTTAAAQAIAGSAARANQCRVGALTIAGLQPGGSGDLAERRAQAVARALAADGLSSPSASFDRTSAPGGTPMKGIEVRVHLDGPA
jgi:hypothetical protein